MPFLEKRAYPFLKSYKETWIGMQDELISNKKKRLTSFRIIIFSFAGLILAGTLLLLLPVSVKDGSASSFSDALFTATSAVCVTGLVVCDTATHWSVFGQSVILVLIQIGGLGVVLVAISFALFSGKRITLMQRSTMQEAIGAPKVGGIVRLTRLILKGTVLIELAGTLLLLPVFCREYGLSGIRMALFHSISAFCNAGFDLTGSVSAPYVSLSAYAGEPLLNATILGLIVIGGVGFLTWEDVCVHRFHFKRYRLQSKLVLVTTAVLIVLPAAYFFFFEFRELPLESRIWNALFLAITPRTAGFSTVDAASMSGASRSVLITLMLIGGSPGSTAGGMKTATAAVLLISAVSVFRKREDPECFGRRIEGAVVKRAAAILTSYLVLFMIGALVISGVEGIAMSDCLFETASAIGTVGLTTGITPQLGAISRGVLILLMFWGRTGGLTLIYAAISGNSVLGISKLPKESITLG